VDDRERLNYVSGVLNGHTLTKGDQMMKSSGIAIVGMLLVVAASSVIAPTRGAAAPSYSGTVTGSFDDLVLSGAYLQVGTHLPVPRDNTSSAAASGIGTSSLVWSDDTACPVSPSTLTFTGDSFNGVAPGQVFPLGTLTYFNGSNGPAALIFGVTLHLSAGDGVTAFTAPADIVSTQNGNLDRVADADRLFFGNFEAPSTLSAFEGAAVSAIVYGKIVGDAGLEVTSIALAQGEADHGCVDVGPRDDSTGPCASACGGVCAAITRALAGPLCGSEQLPASLDRRIGHALDVLSQAAGAKSERNAKRKLAVVMKRLRRSTTIAERAAKRGRISAACAAAVGNAVRNAQGQAEPLVSAQ